MTKARILADYVAGGTTAAEFDYMDGVTSNVQTQLDAKLPLAGGTMTGNIVMGDDTSIGISDSDERIEFDGAGDISVLGANLGIGTTVPPNPLTVQGVKDTDILTVAYSGGTSDGEGAQISFENSGYEYLYARIKGGADSHGSDTGFLSFATNATSGVGNGNPIERMRIDSSGKVGIGVDNSLHGFYVSYDIAGDHVARFKNTSSSACHGILIEHANRNDNNNTRAFVYGNDSAGAVFRIFSDGTFVDSSDRRIKENIVDVESMLDKVNSLRVVKYNRIHDVDKRLRIGAIAQEVQEIFPHLINILPAKDAVLDDDGNTIDTAQEERYMLYKIGLIYPAIKAIQELSAKVTALENA